MACSESRQDGRFSTGWILRPSFPGLNGGLCLTTCFNYFPKPAIPFTVGCTPDNDAFANADLAGFRAVMG
ncbi:MAG: hypothetical protein VXY82_09595 [Planctomycetota bacterium]|nr:hypothetical protein [Planctomycetota bacterium]